YARAVIFSHYAAPPCISILSLHDALPILARLTVYVETQSGMPDLFDKYVDRTSKNPCDIEHIWANDFGRYQALFADEREFHQWRSEEHTSELESREKIVCRLQLEKKNEIG